MINIMYLYKSIIKSKQIRIFKNKNLKLSRDWSLLQNIRKQGLIFWHEIFLKFNPYLMSVSASGLQPLRYFSEGYLEEGPGLPQQCLSSIIFLISPYQLLS